MSMLLIYIYKYKVRLFLSPRPPLRSVSVLGESPRLLRQTGAGPSRRRHVLVAPLGTEPGNGVAHGILRPAVDARCRQTVPVSILLERRHRRAHAVGAEHLTRLAVHRRDFAELLAEALRVRHRNISGLLARLPVFFAVGERRVARRRGVGSAQYPEQARAQQTRGVTPRHGRQGGGTGRRAPRRGGARKSDGDGRWAREGGRRHCDEVP